MSYDPDLYGPPEYEPEDPGQDDDWEALLQREEEIQFIVRSYDEADDG